jgi:hypothetical protein
MLKKMILATLTILCFTTLSLAQSADVSAVGTWSTTQDWEGEPFTFEWDSGFNYGAEANVNLIGFHFGGRWTTGDFDLNGLETNLEETWSQTNLEAWGGINILGSPLYLLGGYRHWELDLSESNIGDDLNFSFDGIGVGAAIKWDAVGSNLFLNAQGMYYFEVDSSLDVISDKGFDYVLMLKGEIGYALPQGFFAAAGVQFDQIHQDLPEEDMIAPYVDYGFEQTSVTFRVGYRFGI